MVQTIIDLGEHENKIVNVVKAEFGLSNKNEAIRFIIDKFEQELLEPKLRPEFVKELLKIDKEEGIEFKNMKELRDMIEK